MTSPETLELEAVDSALAGRYVAPEHAELAELALLLRDEKPEVDAGWATHLDRRVESGFPARPRKPLRQRMPWMRKLVPVVAVAACGVFLAGIALTAGEQDFEAGGGGSISAGESASGGEEAQSGADFGSSGASSGEDAVTDDAGVAPAQRSSGGGDPSSDRRTSRRQEHTVSMTMAAPRREIDAVAARIAQVTTQLGGFVAVSSVSTNAGGSLELRVPTQRLDTAIDRLSRLGTVRELSRQSVDITSSVVSARSRLAEGRAERKSLLRQLAEADTLNETESIRARLDIVSREIASARDSLRRVRNRANFANVSVGLVPRSGDDDGAGAWTPGDAFDDAMRVLEVVAGVAVIATAILLPVALVWLLAWLARRGVTRRRRERALDMA
jgi:hypothetical protein